MADVRLFKTPDFKSVGQNISKVMKYIATRGFI